MDNKMNDFIDLLASVKIQEAWLQKHKKNKWHFQSAVNINTLYSVNIEEIGSNMWNRLKHCENTCIKALNYKPHRNRDFR
jgi:hypothetical protein